MRKIDRFLQYLEYKGITENRATIECGLSQGLLHQAKSGKSDLGAKTIDKILTKYQDLSREWLLYGEGKMLKTSTEQTETTPYTVPLVPISAQGGSFNDFVVSVRDSDCEKVISPVKHVDFALTVTGDSMAPEYPGGSQVLVRKVNERAFIEWGRVYVLDTCNGTVIKKLNPGRDDDEVLCVSVNPDYQPFYVKLSDVYGLYRVMMCMTLK